MIWLEFTDKGYYIYSYFVLVTCVCMDVMSSCSHQDNLLADDERVFRNESKHQYHVFVFLSSLTILISLINILYVVLLHQRIVADIS